MTEDGQLKAIAAELAAEGYIVKHDVDLASVVARDDNLPDIILDLYAVLDATHEPKPRRPRRLIIEVANRARSTPKGARRPVRSPLEEDEAVWRFEVLSAFVARTPEMGFRIRFFDVSADQAAARALRATKVRNKDEMAERISADHALLGLLERWPATVQAAVITRLWSHWLRIAAYLYPGREKRELKAADLRTLQKELYDQQILGLRPDHYHFVHQQVLALAEGGDVSIGDIKSLTSEVRRLLDWCFRYYHGKDSAQERAKPDSPLEALRVAIEQSAPAARRQDLLSALGYLYLMQGSREFAWALARLQIQAGGDFAIPPDIFHSLQTMAADIE